MVGIQGSGGVGLPGLRRPSVIPAPAVSIEYVDTSSLEIELAMSKHARAQRVVGDSARKSVKEVLEARLASMNIPDLMTHTREKLDGQVSALREKLESRYGVGREDSGDEALSPEDHGKRLAGFAIGLFDGFLAGSKVAEPEASDSDRRSEFADLVRGAMREGFEAARNHFAGLEQMDGALAKQLQATLASVESQLDRFVGADPSGGEG